MLDAPDANDIADIVDSLVAQGERWLRRSLTARLARPVRLRLAHLTRDVEIVRGVIANKGEPTDKSFLDLLEAAGKEAVAAGTARWFPPETSPCVLELADGWRWMWSDSARPSAEELVVLDRERRLGHAKEWTAKLELVTQADVVAARMVLHGVTILAVEGARGETLAESLWPVAETAARIVGSRLIAYEDPTVETARTDGETEFQTPTRGRVWLKNGLVHRETGPAFSTPERDSIYLTENGSASLYCRDGALHREDGPAEEWHRWDREKSVYGKGKRHWQNGMRHDPKTFFVEDKDQTAWRSDCKIVDARRRNAFVIGQAIYAEMEARLDSSPGLTSSFKGIWLKLERRLPDDHSEWSAAAQQVLVNVVNSPAEKFWGRQVDRAAKALRIGQILATGRFDMLPPHEVTEAANAIEKNRENLCPPLRACGALPRTTAAKRAFERNTTEMLNEDMIEQGIPKFVVAAPRILRGKSMAPIAAMGAYSLESLTAEDAPVTSVLKLRGGKRLEVRTINGETFRPVMAPGRMETLGEESFKRAAKEGVAWRDNPFSLDGNDSHQRRWCAMSVLEICADTKGSRGIEKAENERASAEAISKVMAAAGRLVVIDGIVHKRDVAPTLDLARMRVRGSRDRYLQCLEWKFADGLSMFDDQTILGLPDDFDLDVSGEFGSSSNKYTGKNSCLEIDFAVDDMATALRLMSTWRDWQKTHGILDRSTEWNLDRVVEASADAGEPSSGALLEFLAQSTDRRWGEDEGRAQRLSRELAASKERGDPGAAVAALAAYLADIEAQAEKQAEKAVRETRNLAHRYRAIGISLRIAAAKVATEEVVAEIARLPDAGDLAALGF